jgi:hypothetical protein
VAGAVIGARKIVNCGVAGYNAAAEIYVGGIDARVEDVDGDAPTREVVAVPFVVYG